MLLKEITPHNLGPFAFPAKLRIEPDITVLTGPNDAGKSWYLRLIELMCGAAKPGTASESDVNSDYLLASARQWDEDASIKITATFIATDQTKAHIPTLSVKPGDEFAVNLQLAPRAKNMAVTKVRRKATKAAQRLNHRGIAMPSVVVLPIQSEIRDVIEWPSPNPAETGFLDFAFKGKSKHAQVQNLRKPIIYQLFSRAKRSIDAALSDLLPSKLRMNIDIGSYAEKQQELAVAFVDQLGGHVPISSRGSGVQKLINLIGPLLSVEDMTGHILVLFDEPENSLHPDAQRVLRSILERIAVRPNVQVIYATHSPSMINNMRPEAIRLVTRANKDGTATSVVDNRPIGDNFLPVRISLGMSPADSLLFASLTVVVEGKTEVLCLPFLLRRLATAKVTGFEDVDALLSQLHFFDGEGDNYENFCRLARSQNADVIIFLDGDKAERVKKSELKETHPEVEFVVIEDHKELEEILPRDKYFEALADHLGLEESGCTPTAFDDWCEEKSLPETLTFTRRLEYWLLGQFRVGYVDKPSVMRKAAVLTEVGAINTQALGKLVSLMRTFLQRRAGGPPDFPFDSAPEPKQEGTAQAEQSSAVPPAGLVARAAMFVLAPQDPSAGTVTLSSDDFHYLRTHGVIAGAIEIENRSQNFVEVTDVLLEIPGHSTETAFTDGFPRLIGSKGRVPLPPARPPFTIGPEDTIRRAVYFGEPQALARKAKAGTVKVKLEGYGDLAFGVTVRQNGPLDRA